MKRLFEQFFPLLSWALVISSLLLEVGVRKRMGIYRDIAIRNQWLTSGIFTQNKLEIYKWIILTGIVLIVTLYLISKYVNRDNDSNKGTVRKQFNKYLLTAAVVSAFWILLNAFYPKTTWISFPWLMLAVLIVVVINYIRVLYAGLYLCKKTKDLTSNRQSTAKIAENNRL